MAIDAYMYFQCSVQGPIHGNHRIKRGSVEIISFSLGVKTPYDTASGQASGKRQHQPVKIIKEWGASTPKLFHALVSKEALDLVIEFGNRGKKKGHASEVHFKNATVVHLSHIGGGKEEVVFVFEDLEISGGAPPPETRLAFLTPAG